MQQQHDTKSNVTKTTTTTTPTTQTTTTKSTATAASASAAATTQIIASSALPNAIVQDEQQQHWPALHEAAATGNEALLSNLLSGGILRTAKEPKQGNTALHEAAWRGYSRCVKLLCTPPPQPTTEPGGSKKFSCVLRKRKKQTPDAQRAAAVHSILIGLQNHAGFTALHLAAQQGHNQSCRELLLAGADADIQNKYGDTALHTACRYGHAGASRILLSGNCDANRVNLNGDTPLHISCAMRRRKLTRILLTEGDCDTTIKNAQNETPIDIVIRKSYVEIFDILNSQQRLRQQRKQRHKTDSKKTTIGQDVTDTINWSPYGCHYFPDPRAFPAPKLETLPKEPLAQGEQYYSDLNGCIRKGPIGVGSTCYCAPFFRHIEHKINCNRRSLRRYVHNAKATLGNEVKALAERTTQQIEQLTRDMLCDRVRCESRRRHIDYWLQMAANSQQPDKSGEQPVRYSLSRCQSLDALSENKCMFTELKKLRANNAQSCNLLDDLTVNHNMRAELAATPTELDSLDKQSNLEQLSDDGQTQTSMNSNTNKNESEIIIEKAVIENNNNKLTVKAVIEQRHVEQEKAAEEVEVEVVEEEDEEIETATLTPFVVPKEKMDISPSYAQLKKTLPANYQPRQAESEDILELTDNLGELELTPTPILESISMQAEHMEVLSDTNTDDSELDNPDELVDEPQEKLKTNHAMDYLYALRKRLQNTVTAKTNTLQQLNENKFVNSNGLIHNHHFVNNNYNNNNTQQHLQNRVVPKNAYFHALPTKSQNHHVQNQIIQQQQQQQNRPQNVLSYANLPNSPSPALRQDPRLAQRLGLPTSQASNNLYLPMGNGHTNGNYLSPVNSNSGSSVASSTPDYERALRHGVISRQPIQAYITRSPQPHQANHVGIYAEHNLHANQQHIYNNNSNNNNYMSHRLEPASSQLIYSANTVALGLADETNEVAENEANSAYPLVSSLV